ncbi:larval cuticle protein A2B-like [Rhynchophorus ferrugineus]|uniref:larval cuticle protein A2B-like n=1 Tax=Rhynchophorus ferrugineus TaxID=354439 RepID=UPI003FCE1D2E
MYKYLVMCAFLAAIATAVEEYQRSSYSSFSSAASPAIYNSPIAPADNVAVPVVAKYAASAPAHTNQEEENGPVQYQFSYNVQDEHSGDYHSQEEKRDGHQVVGQYALRQPDGTVRIVKYFDDGHGFNAAVEIQGQPSQAPYYH